MVQNSVFCLQNNTYYVYFIFAFIQHSITEDNSCFIESEKCVDFDTTAKWTCLIIIKKYLIFSVCSFMTIFPETVHVDKTPIS